MLSLTFAVSPAELAKLRRHSALVGLKAAPARGRAVTIVWHDTPTGELATKGLALALIGPIWRFERARPDSERWPPGSLPLAICEAATTDKLGFKLPGGLESRARFAGRETHTELSLATHSLSIRILRGSLHCGPTVRPYGELTLSGPATAVTDFAEAISETCALAVPRATLAAEAIALAAGSEPPVRRLGAVILSPGVSVGEAFPIVVAYLTNVLLYWAHAIEGPGKDPEPVHQMRVALRRLRSAISIFHDVCASPFVLSVADRLRELGRLLGPARDWDVFLAGHGAKIAASLPDDQPFQRLLRAGERRRVLAYKCLAEHLTGSEFRRTCIALAAIGADARWRDDLDEGQRAALLQPVEVFAADVLTRRHRRVIRRGEHFETLDIPRLHDVRLAAKRLRYATEFFGSLFAPKPAAKFIGRLTVLQDRLGDLNDAAVAIALLAELGPPVGSRGLAVGVVRGFATSEATNGRRRLDRAWKRFRALKPFWNKAA